MKEKKPYIGDIIAKRRRACGMTQRQLADKLHVSDKAVSKWETMEANPDMALLLPLAEALDISTDTLLGAAAQPTAADSVSADEGNPTKKDRFRLACFYVLCGMTALPGVLFVLCGALALDAQEVAAVYGDTTEQPFLILFSATAALLCLWGFVMGTRGIAAYNRYFAVSHVPDGYTRLDRLPVDERRTLQRQFLREQWPLLLLSAVAVLLSMLSWGFSAQLPSGFSETGYTAGWLLAFVFALLLQRRRMQWFDERKIYI